MPEHSKRRRRSTVGTVNNAGGATLTSSRDSILDAAEVLMTRVGYEKASIAQICRESGLPVGSVYHHFGSKSGVLAAIMERGSRKFFATMPQPNIDRSVSNEQRMREYWLSAADMIYANLTYFTLETDLIRSDNTDDELAKVIARVRAGTYERLGAVIMPFLHELGIDDAEDLARRLVDFTVVFTRGAVIEAGNDLPRLRELLADLYTNLHATIHAVANASHSATA